MQGQVGPVNVDDLVTMYWEPDLERDVNSKYVPTSVKLYPNQDVSDANFQNVPEEWSERSTCALSIKDGAVILSAKHCGHNPKVIVWNSGDLWRKEADAQEVKPKQYSYFEVGGLSDLSIFVRNSDKGFQEAIKWLQDIVNNSQIAWDLKQVDEWIQSNKLKEYRIVTNRLPGTEDKVIDGIPYPKIRKRTPHGEATMVEAETIAVNEADGTILGLTPRHGGEQPGNTKAIYHGASGSPVAVGKNGMLGVLTGRLDRFLIEEDDEPLRKKIIARLHQKGYLKDDSEASYHDFMRKYYLYRITPITRKNAAKLLEQVKGTYVQWQLKLLQRMPSAA